MNIACCRLLAIALAGILDQIFGDPRVAWHPICLIGNLISWTEKWTRPLFPKTKSGERAAGVYLVVFVLLIATAAPVAITLGLYRLHWFIGVLAESILLYFTFAARSLERESMAVFRALESKGLTAGRQVVSMIVGRDTEELKEACVIKAEVETLLMMAAHALVKRNRKWQGVQRQSFIDVWRIYRRDCHAHASPNSAQTESVMAGALGVQLAGDASYFGIVHHKPTIGDDLRPVERADIARAVMMMKTTAMLGWMLALSILAVFLL